MSIERVYKLNEYEIVNKVFVLIKAVDQKFICDLKLIKQLMIKSVIVYRNRPAEYNSKLEYFAQTT